MWLDLAAKDDSLLVNTTQHPKNAAVQLRD